MKAFGYFAFCAPSRLPGGTEISPSTHTLLRLLFISPPPPPHRQLTGSQKDVETVRQFLAFQGVSLPPPSLAVCNSLIKTLHHRPELCLKVGLWAAASFGCWGEGLGWALHRRDVQPFKPVQSTPTPLPSRGSPHNLGLLMTISWGSGIREANAQAQSRFSPAPSTGTRSNIFFVFDSVLVQNGIVPPLGSHTSVGRLPGWPTDEAHMKVLLDDRSTPLPSRDQASFAECPAS